MVTYAQLPATVPYVWTDVDQQVARGAAPAWYKGTVLTPYLLRTAHVKDAWLIAPGTTVELNPSMSPYPLYAKFFVPRGYEWIKIPEGVTGATIEALCASLLASDPSRTRFPPLYYDLTVADKVWPGGLPIWRLLVDYWGNKDYRYALVQAKGGQDVWTGLTPSFETAVGDKRLTWVLARTPTSRAIYVAPGIAATNVVPPKLAPPKMKVGLNHSWAFNQYGLSFGPHPDWIEAWFDQLPGNLRVAKHRWGVEHVRMFILCNGYNYAKATATPSTSGFVLNPAADTPIFRDRDMWHFDPPAKLDQKFVDDFTRVLKIFQAARCKFIPSLLDFGAFAPSEAGGKRDLARDPDKRKRFFDTVLEPLLAASAGYKDVIYAWEVMNEPSWTTRSFAKPMAVDKGGSIFMYAPDRPIVSASELTDFLADAVGRIEARGFASTVGHRTYDDMSDFPAGKRKQFHFYAWPFMDAQGASVTARVPRYTMPGGLDDAENMFVGEIGSGSHGNAWPELNGADVNDTRDRVFERLKLVARRGYPLALVWGNEGWSWPPNTPPVDTWEFTPDAILGVTDFTFGLFPDGVP